MLKLGFVFPGQGAQYVGMGADLADTYPEARAKFEEANDILGYDLASICFKGLSEELSRTEVTQPAILTASMVVLEVLKNLGISPVIAAGLSLGEYSALVAAQSVAFEDAVRLLAIRGRLMQEAVAEGEGAMLAVSGLANEQVVRVCEQYGIEPANFNCPGQVVVAGYTEAVEAASSGFIDAGGRVTRLAVSVPSHCRLMRPAAEKLAPHIEKLTIKSPAFPVINNVSAQVGDLNQIKSLLIAQLYSPVRWEESLRLMMGEVDYVVEVGPGSVLAGLARRVDRKKVLGSVGNKESLEQLLKKVNDLC
ncbi:MAG: ACP S-malonyltransferase [Methylocystaceae bacterium]